MILDIFEGKSRVLDVGESGEVKDRIDKHDRKDCWDRNRKGTIQFAVLYIGSASRINIEQDIRDYYKPLCGKQ